MLLTERSAVRYDAERRDRRCRSWAYRKAFLFIARSSALSSSFLSPLPRAVAQKLSQTKSCRFALVFGPFCLSSLPRKAHTSHGKALSWLTALTHGSQKGHPDQGSAQAASNQSSEGQCQAQ